MDDQDKLEQLRQAQQEWEQTTLYKTLADMPERQTSFITTSSEPVERLYTPLDLPEFDYLADLGFPGEYPLYARGTPHPAPR